MKSIIIVLVLLSVGLVAADDRLDAVYEAYHHGDVDKARELFRQFPASAVRDGNRLFIGALLEPDAAESCRMLDNAVRADLDGKYIEEAHFRLIQLAEGASDTARVLSLGKKFLQTSENSPYREQMLAMMAAHEDRDGDEEKRYLDLLIEESPGSFLGQSARLVKADYAFGKGQFKTVETQCRRINTASGDDLVPASLIMLSRVGLQQGQTERALLNYNILREQYRDAIGQDELLDALKGISKEESGRESEEVFEGLTYSVQVGVFSVKDNAQNMADRIKGYGYKVNMERKAISDNKYYVVLAGRFKTLNDARIAKEKLERGENDIFRVVVND